MGTGASSQTHTHVACAECEARKEHECHHHHHHRSSYNSKHSSDDRHKHEKDRYDAEKHAHKEKDSTHHHRDRDNRDRDNDKDKREKDRERDKDRDRERDKDKDREKEKDRDRDKDRERDREKKRDKDHKHEKKHSHKKEEPTVDANALLQVLNNIKSEERVVVVEKHTESGNSTQGKVPDALPDNKFRLSPLISKTKIAEQINTVNQMKDRVKNVFMEYKRLYDLLDIGKNGFIAPTELPLLVECGFCTQQELDILISSNNSVVDFKALIGFVAYNLLDIKTV